MSLTKGSCDSNDLQRNLFATGDHCLLTVEQDTKALLSQKRSILSRISWIARVPLSMLWLVDKMLLGAQNVEVQY